MKYNNLLQSELILLLGCNDLNELKGRCDLVIDVHHEITNKNVFVLVTGNQAEATYMFNYLSRSIDPSYINIESSSIDTIDNIINSFDIIRAKNYCINYRYMDNGDEYVTYVNNFNMIHVVSSAYHLKRISIIIKALEEYYGSNSIKYHGSLEYKSCRLITECNIDSNIDGYIQIIKSRKNL